MQPVEKKVFIAQQEKAPETPQAPEKPAADEGLRGDYREEKERLRADLKARYANNVDVRKYIRKFLGTAMRVRDAEYENNAVSDTYSNAILGFVEIHESLEKLPAAASASTE